jgi:hypothetical protein
LLLWYQYNEAYLVSDYNLYFNFVALALVQWSPNWSLTLIQLYQKLPHIMLIKAALRFFESKLFTFNFINVFAFFG